MKKPKFKIKPKALLAFNDDATEIYNNIFIDEATYFEYDREILFKEFNAKEVVKTWYKDKRFRNVVYDFHYGEFDGEQYDTQLRLVNELENVIDVFKQYKTYKAQKQLWRKQNEH